VLPSISSIEELPILLFPLDKDVLTMELDRCFEEFHVENDPTSLHQVAKALVFLQKKYGPPTKLFGKGSASRYVHTLMKGLKTESSSTKSQVRIFALNNIRFSLEYGHNALAFVFTGYKCRNGPHDFD